MNRIGHSHVGHLRGALSNDNFHKIEKSKIDDLKSRFGLEDSFLVGFVFRNQLRKTVSSLLEGLSVIKANNPEDNTKLLLHTNWKEGWDIASLMSERGVKKEDVLTTYFCANCKDYAVHPFSGHDLACPSCNSKGTLNTVSIDNGVFDFQLNEIYNLMDMYVHPFTSGGQEIPVQEAMMTETPIACTNYSCGTDFCNEESGGIPLSWTPYIEFPTRFVKAHTNPASIADAITQVKKMKSEEREKIGKKSRKYIVDNYSIESVGSKLIDIIKDMPRTKYKFDFDEVLMDPDYPMPSGVDDSVFIDLLYFNVLKMEEKDQNGHDHWMHRLSTDLNRNDVYSYFKGVALKHNNAVKKSSESLDDLLDKDDEGRRVAVVLNEDASSFLMSTYFLKDMKDQYPLHNIYLFAPEALFNVIQGNKYIHKILPSSPFVQDISNLEGGFGKKRYFEVAYIPHKDSQFLFSYAHNDKDKSSICIK
tara:strand:- start:3728 stop:5152 length:1425 start_codon:yes stop_codon:yes gene_type:complete